MTDASPARSGRVRTGASSSDECDARFPARCVRASDARARERGAKRASSATVSAVNEIGARTRDALERSGVNGDALEALLRRRNAEAVRARRDSRGIERPEG